MMRRLEMEQYRNEQVVDEYVFMASIIGPRAAMHRVADAYGLQLKTVQCYLCEFGVKAPIGVVAA